MRKKMKSISGKRERFRATFSRTGTKKNYHGFPETTLLFDDVCREKNGQLISDHLWFNNTTNTWVTADPSDPDYTKYDAGTFVRVEATTAVDTAPPSANVTQFNLKQVNASR